MVRFRFRALAPFAAFLIAACAVRCGSGSTTLLSPSEQRCSTSINPTSATADAGGSTGSFAVTTSRECQWTASISASWIQLTSNSGTGPGTLAYEVASNRSTASRTADVSVGSVHATITQQASSCPFTVTPAAIAAGSGAADLTSALATEDFCSWSATSQASWITVDPASGNGNAQLTLHVNANPAAARHGVIVVGSASIAVDQAAATACTFTVAPSSYSASAAGGGVQVSVGTTGGCNWSVTGNPNWITVSPASGSGTGILTLSIQANSGSARTATLTIGNQSFVVTQAAASATCTYSISPTSFNNVPASGGNTSVTITAQAGCSWSVVGSPSWLTASKTTGTGGGTTTITVQSNSGAARNATLQIGGQNFPVSQAAGAASCTYQPNPTSFNVSSNSQSQLTTFVLTQGGCPSAATANVSWIQITAVPGFGNGNVVFDVSRNSGSSARTGTFTITGQSFSGTVTVTQDGR